MIIQCEQCRTKFKLDDERITERGVRVRCAKCRHVFTVRRPETDSFDGSLSGSAPPPIPTEALSGQQEGEPLSTVGQETDFSFDEQPESPSDNKFEMSQTDAATVDSQGFDFGEASFDTAPLQSADTTSGSSFGDETVVMQPSKKPEVTSESQFNFGEVASQSTESDQASSIQFDMGESTSVAPEPEHGINFDFGDAPASKTDEPFGFDVSGFADSPTAKPLTTSTQDDFGFSFDEKPVTAPPKDDIADSFNFGDNFSGQEQTSSATFQKIDRKPFDTDTVEPHDPFAAAIPASDVAENAEQEAPPLSINSRRRSSPIFTAIISIVVIIIFGVLGYVGYLFIGKGQSVEQIVSKPAAGADGKLSVRNINAFFINKPGIGDILVINGEAVNNLGRARAAIQLKATLFASASEHLSTKLAYAGNKLSREQIIGMPKEKIEETMSNQFGDSLSNLEILPGASIPFTIVIFNPPTNAKEFSVEVSGSTVAAGE